MAKKKIGVILSGCGVKDGSEIHEATLTLYFLSRFDAESVCMAPDKDQFDVVDHLKASPTGEKRNIMREAARIARGDIRDVKTVKAADLDGVVLPGGFGAAKDGADCRVDEDVAGLLKEMHRQKKPIVALCIAPALIASLFGKDYQVELTIGTDAGTASALAKMGAKHKNAGVTEVVVDGKNKIITTPCYMLGQNIGEVGEGIRKAIEELMTMVG
jgi:enhancing lycopene biosynthesis protein 2